MQGTKTRTTLIPDIRPENIETITESYTPSIGGGVEQTSSYKVLNTYPIIGGILDKLAFIRTHAAAVWYNKLAKRTVKDEIDDLKRKIDVMPFIENLELKANVAHEITSDKNLIVLFIFLAGIGTFGLQE